MRGKNKYRRIAFNIIYPLISLGIIFLIWFVASLIKDNPLILPMPKEVISKFIMLGIDKNFWISVGTSLLRTLIAFSISFIFANFFAILAGIYAPINKVMSPIVAFLRSAPTVAVILIIYAFMSSNAMSIVVGFLIAFPIMYSSFYSLISSIDRNLIKMANIYKVSFFNKIINIYFLSIGNSIFDTSKATISLTLKVIIASEILTYATPGIGGNIQTAYASFEVSYLLAWTLIAILFSFILEILVLIMKKIFIRW